MNKSKIYIWRWKDENGADCGWNSCSAYSKREARKIAKSMESKPRDFNYEVYTDSTCTTTKTVVGRNKGLFVNYDTLRWTRYEEYDKIVRATNMD